MVSLLHGKRWHRQRHTVAGLAAIVCVVANSSNFVVAEDLPGSLLPSAKTLRISPAEIRLGGANRTQQLLITAEDEAGRLFDVTHACSLSVEGAIARVEDSVVQARGEGQTLLHARYGAAEASVGVVVKDLGSYPPLHFASDVLPLFSKLGCNSGGCHGKQSGQNGFKLSVFGFDPRADYNALVKEGRGRRLFPAAPEQSLLIRKATGVAPHGGGRRTEPDSADHELLVQWVKQGMPWGTDDAPRLVSVRVEPSERVMLPRGEQQVLVSAIYSDGGVRDVTSAAAYTSNADNVAEVEPSGLVRTGQTPGEAAITVNYMGQVGVVRFVLPRRRSDVRYVRPEVNNRVDELVWARLELLGIEPSPLADDATFLRRLYLDAIGTLPEPAQVRKFLADSNPDKRRQAIDTVLARREFADYWALKWADILLVDREKLGERGARQFQLWLRDQFARNRPYDQWARELILAGGDSGREGPVNFYRALRTPEDLTKGVSQAFLGLRLDCAQCHHHPFDKWSQQDFYSLAGYFGGLVRKPLSGGREIVYFAQVQEIKVPHTQEVLSPRPPDGPAWQASDADPREQLAAWMTSPENPWFARLVANRLWKQFLGRGLVEPEDDLRATNPATNEPLLAWLAEQVVANKYDLTAVMRLILNSRVYQLASVPNATNHDDDQNFSHYPAKRMPAEVLLDAICQTTGVSENYPGLPPGTRAIELWDNRWPSYFLDTFGRSERTSPCECAKSSEPTMAQALHLMNAPEIEAKLANPSGRVAKLVAAGHKPGALVEELCLAALGRLPNEKERRIADDLFARHPPQQAAEDFTWTLLNSYDFLFVD